MTKSWRLNERMYGGLQGLNKSETAARHGEEQVKVKKNINLSKYFRLFVKKFNLLLKRFGVEHMIYHHHQ